MSGDMPSRVEFSSEGDEPFFFCPVSSLGPFVAFLVRKGVAIAKVESGIHPVTGEETRCVFIEASESPAMTEFAKEFNSRAR